MREGLSAAELADHSPRRGFSGYAQPLWLAAVVIVFCLPLFLGLGRADMENDEAIYSYAVDGIVAHGDWLNPLLSPYDATTFLEKPPLKFWIVAAPIVLGVLPHNELGMRVWDALFGAVAFLYVFAIGRRLAGPLCGALAVFVLFVYGPLLFDHGLRNNNMEAPLVLAYCGGIYHYLAWARPDRRHFRAHATAVTLYFVLGFMTKSVAIFFLPILLAAATLVHPATLRQALRDWRLWSVLALATIALVAPWFVYQYNKEGNGLFRVMFGEHVYTRFTASLDPHHLHPWNYYYTVIYEQLGYEGTLWLAIAGGVLLLFRTVREPSLEKLMVVSWFAVPLALMSLGSSKLHHYVYPFLPPIALAAGFGPAWLFSAARSRVDAFMEGIERKWIAARGWGATTRNVFMALAVVAVAIAVATIVLGRVELKVGGVMLFRNSAIARPIVIGLVLAALAGHGVAASRVLLPAAVLVALLPIDGYKNVIENMMRQRHPLRTMRDCLLQVRASELAAGRAAPGIYAVGEERWFLHQYFYYLRNVGGWERSSTLDAPKAEAGLFTAGQQRPLLLGEEAYRAIKDLKGEAVQSVPSMPLREVVLLTPGPYAPCAPALAPLSTQ